MSAGVPEVGVTREEALVQPCPVCGAAAGADCVVVRSRDTLTRGRSLHPNYHARRVQRAAS